MDAKQLEIELKNIDIKFLERIIYKLFTEKFDDLTQPEIRRIYNLVMKDDNKEERK